MAANSTDDLAGSLKSLVNATRSGFETYVELKTDLSWARAAALSSNNTVLAATDAIDLASGNTESMDKGINTVSGLSANSASDREEPGHGSNDDDDDDDNNSDDDSGDGDSAAATHALTRAYYILTTLVIISLLV